MPKVKCLNCQKEFNKIPSQIKRSPNHYCSRSCAVSMNNIKTPRKVKTKKCKCGELILSDRKKCPQCIKDAEPKDITLEEAIYKRHHKSSAYALVRSRARSVSKKLGWSQCRSCSYDKHVEIAHIKPISEFSEDTLLSTINNESNLLPLCPNCHWEFDNGLLMF